ncbi:MAG TPA: response regulator [Phycisphaerae bacterium]|nr:response regulator [Phycisphaerae bacterium]
MQDGKHVILYVEDDQDMLDSIRPVLEGHGYLMVEANTAEDGLRVYQETRPDLLIVDLMMEEIDAGTRLVKELQALGNTAPIYMLSSVGDGLSMTIDTSDLGLSGVLQKPVDHRVLLDLLKAKLGA